MKKVALIGLGKMGISHLAIANSTCNIEVVAVCDTSKALIRSLHKNLGFRCYSDYRKLLENETLDAAIISVPNSLHFRIVKECLEADLHVFIEKPLTLNYDQSLELTKIANSKNKILQVGYVNRFNPIFSRLKYLLEENIVGGVQSYNCTMLGGVVLEPISTGWRNDYKMGGGCLYDYGPHCIDLAIFLFGEDIHLTSSSLRSIFSSKVDDVVEAQFSYPDTAKKGEIIVNWSDNTVRKATNRISVTGEKGRIEANKQEIKMILDSPHHDLNLDIGEHSIYITDLNTSVDYYLRGEDFSRQMREFSDSINGGSKVTSSINGALITDKIINQILEKNGVGVNG